ncbi:hypothetical protein SCHPADRAFT_1000511 [Schizopora paradoxa]|uniref:Uncharacterized protein n=1 Tax=Schizopora paradoxa TaxID=27342 RepID=A0A0H2RWA5_9AGAM|nr:hypothetical protein SCHPADRAFT_1000511 [Schizopora paradoxa]
MGQTLSATLAYPPVEAPATDRRQATVSIELTDEEGRDLLKESRKSASPRAPAMPHPSMATGARDENSEARTQECKLPNDAFEDEVKFLKKCFDDVKRPLKRLGDRTSKFRTNLHKSNLLFKFYPQDAQANGLQLLLRRSIARTEAVKPFLSAGEDSTAEDISALRESLEHLGQSSEYEPRDKKLFQAIVDMTYILDSDWSKLQRMEGSFKDITEHSRHCQKEDREMITHLGEMEEQTRFEMLEDDNGRATGFRRCRIASKVELEISNETPKNVSSYDRILSPIPLPQVLIHRDPSLDGDPDATLPVRTQENDKISGDMSTSGPFREQGLTIEASDVEPNNMRTTTEHFEDTIVNPSGLALVNVQRDDSETDRLVDQANDLQIRFQSAEPPSESNKDKMLTDLTALRDDLQLLIQSSEYNAADKELFQAISDTTETLEKEWNEQQETEIRFKEIIERSRRFQQDDRALINAKTEHIRKLANRQNRIRKRTEHIEKKNARLEKRISKFRDYINPIEIEIEGMRSLLGTK